MLLYTVFMLTDAERLESLKEAESLLANFVAPGQIIMAIEKKMGLKKGSLVGRKRTHAKCVGRSIFVKRMRAIGYSYPEIGEWLKRDHSTIIHLDKVFKA